jgi:arylsulfatase A-like enzyme
MIARPAAAAVSLLLAVSMMATAFPMLAEASAPDFGTPQRPNIVFILADDLGWRDLGCFGSTFYQTPHLDALAARGIVFRQAYAANPLCSPTRASILTGLYPARIGITAPVCHQPEVRLTASIRPKVPADQKSLVCDSATRLDTRYVTLAETLRAAGYQTGHFGKWHLGREPYSPLEQGFTVDVPHHFGPGPAGSYLAPWRFPPQSKFTGKPGEHVEDRLASEAAKFIRANKDRPFFLNYWAFSAHGPWDAKPELIAKYAKLVNEGEPQRNPLYAAMIESLDDAVGTLVKTLDECGLSDNTLIVFFSDNGGVNWGEGIRIPEHQSQEVRDRLAGVPPTSNAPLRGGKASLYEGGQRVPCIITWPAAIRPRESQALIQSIDFYPTLAEIAGAKPPADQTLDGRSFAPLLLGESDQHRQEVFSYFPHRTPASDQVPGAWVRQGDWKLIRLFNDGPGQDHRHELYNLAEDLSETHDLVAAEPARVAALSARIDWFLSDTGALVPGPNPNWSEDAKTPPRRNRNRRAK